jgi:hypothetical protein
MELDHLVIIAPSLAEGAAHVRARLGIEMPAGGKHPQMGTHNLLLRLGEGVFLEVIAVDPEAERPGRPRWFGLDDAGAVRAAWAEGRRLRAWVARTDDLDAVLARHGALLGAKTRVSRGDRSWDFALRPDGALPADGALPPVIDWGPRGNPASAMPDLGATLVSFRIEHPEPARVAALHGALGIVDPPDVRPGPRLRYRAVIDTPGGVRELD